MWVRLEVGGCLPAEKLPFLESFILYVLWDLEADSGVGWPVSGA